MHNCSGFYKLMEGEGSFTITKKESEGTEGAPVGKFQQLTVTTQRQGSSTLTHRGAIGRTQFSPALEAVLLQMHQGDRWELEDQNKTKFTVTVKNVGGAVDSRNHIQRADALKLEGNNFIKQKDNAAATRKYQQAYNLIVNDPSSKASQLKLSLISNLALACLNLGEFKSAIAWCNEHLEETLEPNLKVIYRKASANKGLRNWAQARKDIEFGIANSSNDAESLQNFKKLLIQLQKEEIMQEKKEKAVYGKMFG